MGAGHNSVYLIQSVEGSETLFLSEICCGTVNLSAPPPPGELRLPRKVTPAL